MIKTLLLGLFVVGCAYSAEIMPAEIQMLADGITNYKGIRYAVEKGQMTDGSVLILTIDTCLSPKWVDLFVINSAGDTIVGCGVEGREKEESIQYRVDLESSHLTNSELWIFLEKKSQIVCRLNQIINLK